MLSSTSNSLSCESGNIVPYAANIGMTLGDDWCVCSAFSHWAQCNCKGWFMFMFLTYRCAGCCVLTAVELSQGSSSGPTQTGICTPLCRSELLQPRCWSRSGTPAAAAESDRLMPIVSFIVKTTAYNGYYVFHAGSLWLSPTTLLPGQTVWTIITNMSQVAFGEMKYHLFHRGLAH